jgi:hypothetical protein
VIFDVQEAVRIYLDPQLTGGFEPIYGEERLRARYGADLEQVKARIREFLDPICAFDVSTLDLCEIADRTAARARDLHPDLDPVLCRSIGNYLSYSYK